MFGNGHRDLRRRLDKLTSAVSELSGDVAESRTVIDTQRDELKTLRHDLEAARLDYAELAAKAYRWLKGAERARARAEAEDAPDPQQQELPEIPVGTSLRNTRLARSRPVHTLNGG